MTKRLLLRWSKDDYLKGKFAGKSADDIIGGFKEVAQAQQRLRVRK